MKSQGRALYYARNTVITN